MQSGIPILEVRFYAASSGAEPVREWLLSLCREDRKAIGEDIKTVQFGWPLGMPVVRKMSAGLWEVRSHVQSGIARVFFTVVGHDIVLLHGFVKKSQRTPAAELGTATQRMKEVQNAPSKEVRRK